MTPIKLNEHIITYPNFISEERCKEILAIEREYEVSPIATKDGAKIDTTVRNNTRSILFSKNLAKEFFELLKEHLPTTTTLFPDSLNEMLRYYKYVPGEYFNWHRDAFYVPPGIVGVRSYYTFMVYLNEGYEGGETEFRDEKVSVKPQTGMGLLFLHTLVHKGASVISGEKHVIRTDVMYNKK